MNTIEKLNINRKQKILKIILAKNNINYLVLDSEQKVFFTNLSVQGSLVSNLLEAKDFFSPESFDKIQTILQIKFEDAFEMTIKERYVEHILYNSEDFPGYLFIESHLSKNAESPNKVETPNSSETSDEIKNLQVLQELLDEMQEMETQNPSKQTIERIKTFFIPQLSELKDQINDSLTKLCFDVIRQNLEDFVDSTGQMDRLYQVLTPSEVKVAEFIRQGMTSKDIASALNVAQKTVDNHRNNLREKLGIKNKGVNLQTYLMQTKTDK